MNCRGPERPRPFPMQRACVPFFLHSPLSQPPERPNLGLHPIEKIDYLEPGIPCVTL